MLLNIEIVLNSLLTKAPEFKHFNATIIALKIVPENKTKKYQKTISN